MAERRMFAKTIIDSDAFLDMPLSTQALYFHLSMRADDDGFINNPKKIQRMIGASDDDARILVMKKFLIPFESGVVVIKHWKIHNYIRNDRYKETVYKEEKAMLIEKENKGYTLGIPNGYQMETQVRLGKDSIVENNINSASSNAPSKKDISEFLESIWKLYPNKKGKGQISDSKKKTLYEIGYEELSRAIERYTSDLKKEEWRKAQNGSTFFNSGYVDYLDANYSPLPEKEKTTGRNNNYRNKFNNAPQRNYEMDALERMLLEQQNFKPETDASFLAEAEALQKELQQKYGR